MDNKYSLTYPQKNIWMVEEFFGKSPINTIVGLFYVNNGFDREKCEIAINKIVELNDALRLQLYKEDDNVFQKIVQYDYFKVDFYDLTECGKTEEELNQEITQKPFDIINSPLYYFAIVKISKDRAYIFTKLHHLVADAWTYSNIANMLSEFIEGMTEDDEKPSYLEFIDSEKEYVLSERFIKDKEFWQEYLDGLEECVSLKDIDKVVENKANRYTITLDNVICEELKNYCKVNRVSPYTVFMTSLAIYVHRVTSKEDFVIGTPVLNRTNAREKKMLGMFVSTMPVRFKIDEKITFTDMCKSSSRESLTQFRHQKYPYSLILKDFKEKNDLKSNLYSIMLSYQNARFDSKSNDKSKYTTEWVFSKNIQNELEIHIMDMDETGTFQVHFDYQTELFKEDEIKFLADRIITIIKDGIENNATIRDIKIMSDEEMHRILYEYNDTVRDYPRNKTVVELFEEQAKNNPEAIAVVFENSSLTYQKLNERANFLAQVLKENGVRPHDAVGIIIDKSFDLIIAILATLKTGAFYVPVEKNYNNARKEFMLINAGANIVLTDEDEENINLKQIKVSEVWGVKRENVTCKKTPDDANCVLYTSGTTGEPKGALLADRNITKLVKNPDYITFQSSDRILQAASTSFDVSLFEIWGALLNGATLYLIKKSNLVTPSVLKKNLQDNMITILWITSALFNQMIEADAKMFKCLRRIFTGGDVISIKHVNMLKEACPSLLITNCYGPTECVAFTNTYNIYDKMDRRVPLGRPISNTTGYVMDKKDRLLPLYVQGEYVIGGESVGIGYINKPELTHEKFIKNTIDNKFIIDRLYKTGDIVQMIDNGKIDFIGRRDNQIKIRGYRIELDEIKVNMQSFNKVRDAVAIVKEKNGDKRIIAYYTSDVKEDNMEFTDYLKTKLPFYMIPSSMLQLDKIPINQNGKIDRKNLPDIENTVHINEGNSSIEYTGIYKIIYEVFKEVTGIEIIGKDDSFFEIGGDSVSVIKVISKLSKNDIQITFQDVYKYPSIKELGDMISKNYKARSISENLKNMDFSMIDKLLEKNVIKKELVMKNESKNILLTGATGFLGAHILNKYIESNSQAKVYCIVRAKGNLSGNERLKQRLAYFFGEEYVDRIKQNVAVIEGDILDKNIFENENIKVISDIDIIINSAAYVKHFGSLELFEKINTESVAYLADIASKYNKEFIQISTLSVSGNILENGQVQQTAIKPGTIFNENKIYIGQDLDNVYAYSKFLGEKEVYDRIISKGLKAKVIRMGNLTGRLNDGKFQPNVEENAFAQRLKTIIDLKLMPENLLDFDVEFTPIDCAAEAIVKLSNLDCDYNTFHLFNDNHIKMSRLNQIFKELNINLEIISKDKMTKVLTEFMDKDYSKIQGIAQDLNSNKELDYNSAIKIKEDFTKKVLDLCGFRWPELGKDYIKKYLIALNLLKENE